MEALYFIAMAFAGAFFIGLIKWSIAALVRLIFRRA